MKTWSDPAWYARHAKPLILGVLALVAYIAAVNRFQALPWAIAALLTATLIAGVSWPYWLVKRLLVIRSGPTRAEEGDTIEFTVEVTNHGLLPRFMVELTDRLPFAGASHGAPSQERQSLGVVSYLPAGGKRSFGVPIVCEKRGFYRLGPLGLASSFPLGLSEQRRSLDDGFRSLTVYPDIFPISRLPLQGALSQIHRGGYLLPKGVGAAEFSGLREYRRGDNPRHVHWPTTARLNELMVKEFEPLASAALHLVLDQCVTGNIGLGKHSTFEYSVRIAGSIARYGCNNSIPTRILGDGRRPLHVPAGTGDGHYRRVLDELAVVDAVGATPYAQVLRRVAMECRHGETMVVFLGDTPSAETLIALALARTRGAWLFALLFDNASFQTGTVASDDEAAGMGALLELGADCLQIRRGDDLMKLFNA